MASPCPVKDEDGHSPHNTGTHKNKTLTSNSYAQLSNDGKMAPAPLPPPPAYSEASLCKLVMPPDALTVPILLPRLNQMLLPGKQNPPQGNTPTLLGVVDKNEQAKDTTLFDWHVSSLPPSLSMTQEKTETEPTPEKSSSKLGLDELSHTNLETKARLPLEDAFSSLLVQHKVPSVRFATHDEICYYSVGDDDNENSSQVDREQPSQVLDSAVAEEGFQMDHVFDDIGTVTAAPPMIPPRRCPSLDSLEIRDHEDDFAAVEQDAARLVRASMPRHGSVESETTLSFSSNGDCCSSSQDEEDTLSGFFSLIAEEEGVENEHIKATSAYSFDASSSRSPSQNDSERGDEDSRLIREIMESLRGGGTTTATAKQRNNSLL